MPLGRRPKGPVFGRGSRPGMTVSRSRTFIGVRPAATHGARPTRSEPLPRASSSPARRERSRTLAGHPHAGAVGVRLPSGSRKSLQERGRGRQLPHGGPHDPEALAVRHLQRASTCSRFRRSTRPTALSHCGKNGRGWRTLQGGPCRSPGGSGTTRGGGRTGGTGRTSATPCAFARFGPRPANWSESPP